MKKFFIPSTNSVYYDELLEAYSRATGDKVIGEAKNITADYMGTHQIDVVICNELSKDQFLLLKGLEIPVITIGKTSQFLSSSDIVIDWKAEDDKRYFSGSAGRIKDNFDFRIDKIVNLVEKLEWDSQFFGFNVAYLSCMHLTQNIMSKVQKFVDRENVRLVEYLCNCHNAESVKLAEKYGFHFVDIRLVFRQQVLPEHQNLIALPDGYSQRVAHESDIPALTPIARNSYVDSRYFFDNHFPEERCQQFYEDWLRKSVRSQFDDVVFTICHNDQPIAFISAKKQSPTLGKIGLVGVHEDYQGKGIGRILISQFLKWAHSETLECVDVVTQGRNYSAQKLYQNMGFRTKLVQLWYHKWIY